jgi:hypothetical protein
MITSWLLENDTEEDRVMSYREVSPPKIYSWHLRQQKTEREQSK